MYFFIYVSSVPWTFILFLTWLFYLLYEQNIEKRGKWCKADRKYPNCQYMNSIQSKNFKFSETKLIPRMHDLKLATDVALIAVSGKLFQKLATLTEKKFFPSIYPKW